jgi:hypothetical protein
MTFRILKVTVIHDEVFGVSDSYLTDEEVDNLKEYRRNLLEKYGCQRIAFIYESIPKTKQP